MSNYKYIWIMHIVLQLTKNTMLLLFLINFIIITFNYNYNFPPLSPSKCHASSLYRIKIYKNKKTEE